MAAKTGTYTLISSNTLGSASASISFTSIPATYTDLIIVCETKATAGTPNIRMQVNSDTATNYSTTVLAGNGTAAASARYTTNTYCVLDYYGYSDTTNVKNTIINIFDYSNTTTYKTVMCRANNAASGTDATVSLWRSTAAISTVTIFPSGSTYVAGSTFKLYGIEAAK